MKHLLRFIRAACAATLLSAPLFLHAQTWQTALDYHYPSGSGAGGWLGVTADALGHVFAGGSANDASNLSHGLVLESDTAATAWLVSDDFLPSLPYTGSDVRGLGFDSNGNLYRSGLLWAPCAKSSCPGSIWHLRKSPDYGSSWTTVESFQYVPGKSADPRGVAGDASGNVFVCGDAVDSAGKSHWLVRKSASGDLGTWTSNDDVSGAVGRGITYVPGIGLFVVGFLEGSKTLSNGWMVRRSANGGASWSTVDLYQLPKKGGAYQDAAALGVSGDAQGNIYVAGAIKPVVGNGNSSSVGVAQWLIRRSTDGGNTWATVDTFSYATGMESSAWGICKDSAGSVVAVGRGHDSQGITHWIVRRPNAQGIWQTVDDYQLTPGKSADAGGIASDAAGNLLVNGEASDANGVWHWIVRRLANGNP